MDSKDKKTLNLDKQNEDTEKKEVSESPSNRMFTIEAKKNISFDGKVYKKGEMIRISKDRLDKLAKTRLKNYYEVKEKQ